LRAAWRGGIVGLFLMVTLIPALPAAALPSGTGPGISKIGDVGSPSGLSLPVTLLIFVGGPVLAFLFGGLMALRPRRGSSRRYRPGRPWPYELAWFGDRSRLEYEPKRAALPGAGGASGRW
jgi:hypothetical protein